MKKTQHLSELRQMELPELDARLKEVRTELFNLRFQAATGQLDNHRQIAAVLTVIQGRRLGIEDLVTAEADIAAAGGGAATATAVAEVETATDDPSEAAAEDLELESADAAPAADAAADVDEEHGK
jgi:large subunit ribosomal protein L29